MPHKAVAVISERQKRRHSWQKKSRQELAQMKKRHEQANRRTLLREINEEAVALVALLGSTTPPYKDGLVKNGLLSPFTRHAVWHPASIVIDELKYRELYFRDDGTLYLTRHINRMLRRPLPITNESSSTLANIHRILRTYRTQCLREIEANA